MEFKFNIQALKMASLFAPTSTKATPTRLFWFSLSSVLCYIMHYVAIAYYILNYKDIVDKVWLAFHIISLVHDFFRRVFFVLKLPQMRKLIELIEASPVSECEEFERLETEMRVRSRKNIKFFNTALFIYNFCSLQTVVFISITKVVLTLVESLDTTFDGTTSQQLMSPIVWFSDTQRLPTYYLVMLWQTFVYFIGTGIAVTSDSFTCSLVLAAAERSSFLARTAPVALLPGPEGEVTPKFQAWVKYHQHYLRIVDGINEVMGPFVLIIHTITCLYIVLYSFALLKVTDSGKKSIAVFTMVGMMIRIFVYATAGQKILDQSVQLRQSVVHVSQVTRGGLQHVPFRSCLQVLVTRLSGGAPPEEVSGLGFFTVNFEFFNSVLSASFSYLMVLLSFK